MILYTTKNIFPKFKQSKKSNNWKPKARPKTIWIRKNKPLFIENELNKCVLDISLKPEWKKTMDRQSFKSGYLKNSK